MNFRPRHILHSSFLILCCLLCAPLFAHASTIRLPSSVLNLNSGLVGWWTFDAKNVNWATGVVSDSSGNGATAHVVGLSTTTSVVEGKVGQALRFVGQNDGILADNANSSVKGQSNVTVSGWVNLSDYNSGNGGEELYFEPTNSASDPTRFECGLGLNGDANGIVSMGGRTLDSTPGETTWVHTIAVVPLHSWHLITCVYNTSGGVAQIYLDGNLSSSSPQTLGAFSNTNPFINPTIGYDNLFSDLTSLDGVIDNVRIYNRALSATEILQLYNATKGSKIDASQLSATENLNSGLVGWWTMDGKNLQQNVADSSGQGSTGFLTSFVATSSAVVQGKIGQSLTFNGTGYVNAPHSVSFNSMTSVTTCAWIFPTNPNDPGEPLITGSIDTLTAQGVWFNLCSSAVCGASNSLEMFVNSSGGTSEDSVSVANTIKINQWQFVCGTYSDSGSRIAKLYVNGTEPSYSVQTAMTGTMIGTSANFLIGREPGDAGSPFNGKIDDVRIYNRVLSATEILQLYNATKGSKIDASQLSATENLNSGLVGWWTMDGKNMQRNVTDSSGQGNNGFMKNFTSTSSAVVEGKVGQALNFTSGSQEIDINSDPMGTGAITVSAWVYGRSFGNTGSGRIIDNGNFRLGDSNGNNFICTSDGGATQAISAANSFQFNHWYFVACTRDAAGIANVYVNGSLSGSANQNSGTPGAGSTPIKIGARQAVANSAWDGYIDDVRVYNRILSATEIQQLYNSSR